MDNTITFYATTVTTESNGKDQQHVTATGIDPDNVLYELAVEDVIDFVLANYHDRYLEAVAAVEED